MLFLGIISWKGVSCFNGGEGVCFPDGGLHFKVGGAPLGRALVLMGEGGFQNYCRIGGHHPCPPTMGNPDN